MATKCVIWRELNFVVSCVAAPCRYCFHRGPPRRWPEDLISRMSLDFGHVESVLWNSVQHRIWSIKFSTDHQHCVEQCCLKWAGTPPTVSSVFRLNSSTDCLSRSLLVFSLFHFHCTYWKSTKNDDKKQTNYWMQLTPASGGSHCTDRCVDCVKLTTAWSELTMESRLFWHNETGERYPDMSS